VLCNQHGTGRDDIDIRRWLAVAIAVSVSVGGEK